jgi:hypothetical protein
MGGFPKPYIPDYNVGKLQHVLTGALWDRELASWPVWQFSPIYYKQYAPARLLYAWSSKDMSAMSSICKHVWQVMRLDGVFSGLDYKRVGWWLHSITYCITRVEMQAGNKIWDSFMSKPAKKDCYTVLYIICSIMQQLKACWWGLAFHERVVWKRYPRNRTPT